jgi:hypothetical protein
MRCGEIVNARAPRDTLRRGTACRSLDSLRSFGMTVN